MLDTGSANSCTAAGEYDGENGRKKGLGEIGLAVRSSITRATRPLEVITDRLLRVTLERHGRAKATTIFMAYTPTETQNVSNKHAFWTTLGRAVEEVPVHKQLFVLMDANARTGRREKERVESKDNKIFNGGL